MIATNKYGKYVIPDNHDRPVTQKLREGKVYEPDTIKFLRNNHNNGSIVTAGTYIGDFLPGISKACRHKIYGFEPVPENYKYAKINCLLNDLDNVLLQNICLSDHTGTIKMRVFDVETGNTLGGGSHVTTNPASRDIDVPCKRLDSLIPSDDLITIIQLDVERHEESVLAGAVNTINDNKPIIIVETLPQEFYNFYLQPLDYTIHSKKLHNNSILYIENKHKNLIF